MHILFLGVQKTISLKKFLDFEPFDILWPFDTSTSYGTKEIELRTDRPYLIDRYEQSVLYAGTVS